jgi:hypothetical protein
MSWSFKAVRIEIMVFWLMEPCSIVGVESSVPQSLFTRGTP